MNTEKITSLFLLFSGEESAEEFEPIIDLAVRLTEKMLNSEADKSDLRVDFLAAALANYHVQQLKSAHDRTTAAFTERNSDSSGFSVGMISRITTSSSSSSKGIITA